MFINKKDTNILVKSIIDIHTYKSNPSNILQINWQAEFNFIDYVTSDEEYITKITSLFITIQRSIKQSITNMIKFADADINTIIIS